jgi:hypothetical protein
MSRFKVKVHSAGKDAPGPMNPTVSIYVAFGAAEDQRHVVTAVTDEMVEAYIDGTVDALIRDLESARKEVKRKIRKAKEEEMTKLEKRNRKG